jgi:hypothetical protein
MNFKGSSSRVERERSSMESPVKLRDRGFGREACQSVVRARRGFKILPETTPKCYSTGCRLGKARPNHKSKCYN